MTKLSSGFFRRCIVGVLLLLAFAFSSRADVQYFYDAAGRLVQAVEADGSSVQYQYDLSGDMTSIMRLGVGQLAITSFSPSSGVPGTTVTILGGGFSGTPGQNAVRFNGVAATVVTASAGRLTVTVPTGAASGAISVTTSAGTASSANAFTVIGAPVITGFSPTAGTAGAAVTISGNGFDTVANQNQVKLNGVSASVTSASATSLAITVPASTGSGRFSVTTSLGSGVSADNFIMLPSGYTAADLVTTSVTPDTSLPVSFATGKRIGLFPFEGVQGAGYSLVLTGFTPSGPTVTAKILKPDGTVYWDCGTFSASSGNCDIGFLPSSGTYAVRIDASGSSALSFNLVLTRDQTGTLVSGAAPFTFTTVAPGQNARYVFNGTAGTTLSIVYANNTISAASIYLYKPDGSFWRSVPLSGSSGTVDMGLTATGTYQATLFVDGNSSGHMDLNLVQEAGGTVAINTPTPISLMPGQNGRWSFTATSGQFFSLVLTSFSSVPSGGSLHAYILNSTGAVQTDCGTYSASSGNCDLVVGGAGTYYVYVDPSGVASTSFNIVLSSDQSGVLTINAAPVTFTTAVAGQNIRYTFAGTASQHVTFNYANNTIGAGAAFFYRADGSFWTTLALSGASGSLGLSLPSTGTYKIALLVDGSAAGHTDVQVQSP